MFHAAIIFTSNWMGTRHLTIEEVSVIFDTGRLGDSAAATAEFQKGVHAGIKEEGKENVSYVENKYVSV
jgi:hypothetical protein